MIRIFIVSSIALYREGLSALLACRDGIAVVGAAVDESDAIATLRSMTVPPDIFLVDMSSANSGSATRQLMQEVADARVFAITVPNSERGVVACAELGVAGFVTTDASLN